MHADAAKAARGCGTRSAATIRVVIGDELFVYGLRALNGSASGSVVYIEVPPRKHSSVDVAALAAVRLMDRWRDENVVGGSGDGSGDRSFSYDPNVA